MHVQSMNLANTLRFGAQKLKKPLNIVVMSEGDGSYSAVAFKSAKEAEKFAEAEGNCSYNGFPNTQTLGKIYDTAEEYVREVYGDEDRRLEYLA